LSIGTLAVTIEAIREKPYTKGLGDTVDLHRTPEDIATSRT
jgi:hypothetical protein